MGKKRKNHDNDFILRKADKDGKFHKIFSEFFFAPFRAVTPVYAYSDIPGIYDSYIDDRRLIEIPESTGKQNDLKLLETIAKILNGEEVEIKLKNVRFHYDGNIDGDFIYVNENVFIELLGSGSIRRMMDSSRYSGFRTPLSIRRSLMHYIVNSLNNSLAKQ